MSGSERMAYAEGYQACLDGVSMSQCPSKFQASLRYAWEDGWQAALPHRHW